MKIPKKWTTKEGVKIWIKDMSNSHLLNSINMIEKNTEKYNQEVWLCDLDGFNPRYYEIDLSENPKYIALTLEKERRGL